MKAQMKKNVPSRTGESRIASDPQVCGGVPCVRGTRIPVHQILDYLSAGTSIQKLLREFPILMLEDVRACLAYAARRTEKPVRAS